MIDNEIFVQRYLNSRPFAYSMILYYLENPGVEFDEIANRKAVESQYNSELEAILKANNASLSEINQEELSESRKGISMIEKNRLFQMVEFYQLGRICFDARSCLTNVPKINAIETLRIASTALDSVFLHFGVIETLKIPGISQELYVDGVLLRMSPDNVSITFTTNSKNYIEEPINWYRNRDYWVFKALSIKPGKTLNELSKMTDSNIADNVNPNLVVGGALDNANLCFNYLIDKICYALNKIIYARTPFGSSFINTPPGFSIGSNVFERNTIELLKMDKKGYVPYRVL